GVVAAVSADGRPHLLRGTTAVGNGAENGRARWEELAFAPTGPEAPADLMGAIVDEELRAAWFASKDGALLRVDVTQTPAVRREVRLTSAGDGSHLTAFEAVIGDRSLVVADDRGRVTVWSPCPVEVGDTTPGRPEDGFVTERLHVLEESGSPAI